MHALLAVIFHGIFSAFALKNRHYLLGAVMAALALWACSKKTKRDRAASGQLTVEVESSEVPMAKLDNTQRDVNDVSARVIQPAAARVNFYASCDGKQAGDDCALMLGFHEVRTKCVAMLDEASQPRWNCGERRPPSSRRSDPPRISLDFYGPCEGKKVGDPCVLKQSDPEMRSHCRAASDGSGDKRLSCGVLPPTAQTQ